MAEGGQEITKFGSQGKGPETFTIKDTSRGVYTNIQSAANVQLNGKMTVYMNSDGYKKQKKKPKKPVTKSSQPVSVDQLLNIKDRLGRDWKDLGRRFKIDDAVLDQMHLENKDNMGELNYQILCKWKRENHHQATQANLAKIFVAMSRGDLSDLLAEEDT